MPGCLRAMQKPAIVSQAALLEPTALTLYVTESENRHGLPCRHASKAAADIPADCRNAVTAGGPEHRSLTVTAPIRATTVREWRRRAPNTAPSRSRLRSEPRLGSGAGGPRTPLPHGHGSDQSHDRQGVAGCARGTAKNRLPNRGGSEAFALLSLSIRRRTSLSSGSDSAIRTCSRLPSQKCN
jgi:hypothetical protein